MNAEVVIQTPQGRLFKGKINVISNGKLQKVKIPLMPLKPRGKKLVLECRSYKPSQLTIGVRPDGKGWWIGFDHLELKIGGPDSNIQGRHGGSGRYTSWSSSLIRC
jgi:hypothetical protein